MKDYKHHDRQKAFTLLELMIVTFIIAIIAAIAIPSYQKYIVQNAEQSAQAEMKQLQNQLERWRSSHLTYLGFIPELGKDICKNNTKFCYMDKKNTLLYLPLGSDADNFKYKITIVDANGNKSLVPDQSKPKTKPKTKEPESVFDVSVGRSWKIFAIPQEKGPVSEGRKIMLTSTGVQCMTKDDKITIASNNCGNHSTSSSW